MRPDSSTSVRPAQVISSREMSNMIVFRGGRDPTAMVKTARGSRRSAGGGRAPGRLSLRRSCHDPSPWKRWKAAPCRHRTCRVRPRWSASVVLLPTDAVEPEAAQGVIEARFDECPTGSGASAKARNLAADAETLDQAAVARLVMILDVVEERAAVRNELQKATPRVVVLLVCLEVLGQVVDALRQDR